MKKFYKNPMLVVMISMLVLSLTVLNVKVSAANTINIGILFAKGMVEGGGTVTPGGGAGGGGTCEGATLAANEINAAGGVNVGGTMYTINLDYQDEGAFDLSKPPSFYNTQTTDASMSEMLNNPDQFIIGGFRTETTTEALSKLALWNSDHTKTPVPFIVCGAATNALFYPDIGGTNKILWTGATNDTVQWVNRITPVNDTCLLETVSSYISYVLAPKLASIYTNSTYPTATPGKIRFAVVCESYTWTQLIWFLFTAPAGTPIGQLPGGVTPGYNYFLGNQVTTSGVLSTGGYPYPGDCVIDPLASASDIQTMVNTLKSQDVHLIITAFTMPEINTILTDIANVGMSAMVVGIDVPGQTQQHWADSGGNPATLKAGSCNYECTLCYSGTGTPIVPGYTDVFWSKFLNVTKQTTGTAYWPCYTAAGAYDAIHLLKNAIETAGSLDPAKVEAAYSSAEGTGTTGKTKTTQTLYGVPLSNSGHDAYSDSVGPTWTNYSGGYGYARSEMVQWVQNNATPASPYPFIGAQLNPVSPIDMPYSRRTMIPPTMYSLADAGDINLDGKVSLSDLVNLAKAYGSKAGTAGWNSNTDIDNNGVVGLSDLVKLANNYGKSAPQWPLP